MSIEGRVGPTSRNDDSDPGSGEAEVARRAASPSPFGTGARLPFAGTGIRYHPVAIGGVGGSGTRVVASMIAGLGYDMGISLNRSLDDLLFTFLFRNPDMYGDVRGLVPTYHPSAVDALGLYIAIRNGRHHLTGEKLPMYRRALSLPDNNPRGVKRPAVRALRRYRRVQFVGQEFRKLPETDTDMDKPWGWKLPLCHLFLPTMYAGIPQLRYIHVVRDGLAIAKSKNDLQRLQWGRLFGVAEDDRDPEIAQLVYWARVNLAVAEFLATAPHCLIVSYERSVMDPTAVLQEIAAFLGRPCTDEAMAIVAEIQRPTDFDRSYDYESAPLTPEEREDVVRALKRFSRAETVKPSTPGDGDQPNIARHPV